MLAKVKREVTSLLARVRIRSEEEVAALEAQERAQAEAAARQMQFQPAHSGGLGADEEAEQARLAEANAAAHNPVNPPGPKVGRNDPAAQRDLAGTPWTVRVDTWVRRTIQRKTSTKPRL